MKKIKLKNKNKVFLIYINLIIIESNNYFLILALQIMGCSWICPPETLRDGLPNIGNTCYLNVILQMLFSAVQLRNAVRTTVQSKRPQNQLSLGFHKKIHQIFQDLQLDNSIQLKWNHLEQFRDELQKRRPQFMKFQQNDAVQCLLAILNILQQQDSDISKLKLFQITFYQSCKCNSQPYGPINDYMITSGTVCSTCRAKLQISIHSSGRYLINMQNPETQRLNQLKIQSKQPQYKKHEALCFVYYSGNQLSGHYISYRKDKKHKWLRISDRNVQRLQNLNGTRTPMISLYEKQAL